MAIRRWRKTQSMVVAAVLPVMLLAACGGNEGPPEHFTRVETGWMTIDIPEDWVPVAVDEPWTDGYADADDDSATLLLAISPTFSESSTAREASSMILGSAQMAYPGFRAIPSSEASQADFAHRSWTQFTYSGVEGQEYDGVIWGVADDAPRAVVVQLTGEDLGDDLVATIGDSIKIVEE